MDDRTSRANATRILVVAPFRMWPPHFGSSERTCNLLKQLARDGQFRLSVLYTDYAQVQVQAQSESWRNTKFINVGPPKRWAQILNPWLLFRGLQLIYRERPDIMICEHLWAAPHALILHRLTGVPFVLDDHNAEYIRFQRMQKRGSAIVRLLEKATGWRAEAVICVSEADKSHLIALGIRAEKISVVPNAVDMTQYQPNARARCRVRNELNISDDTALLLFFGKLDYLPNAEAVEIIVGKIMPRVLKEIQTARFVVCGYSPPTEKYTHPQLLFTGVVPKIEDYINASDLVIAPLTSGGGTKLKIIQAIACGKPVVTTSIGAEGIMRAGDWIQVADEWEEFSRLVISQLSRSCDLPPDDLDEFRHHYSGDYMARSAIRVIKNHIEQVDRPNT